MLLKHQHYFRKQRNDQACYRKPKRWFIKNIFRILLGCQLILIMLTVGHWVYWSSWASCWVKDAPGNRVTCASPWSTTVMLESREHVTNHTLPTSPTSSSNINNAHYIQICGMYCTAAHKIKTIVWHTPTVILMYEYDLLQQLILKVSLFYSILF